jgi:hypothetical protein
VRQCWSERFAFVLLPPETQDADDAVLYAYIGGGVLNQPPNTYPLVFKRMPLDIAALVLAVGMQFTEGARTSEDMIYCRDVLASAEDLRRKEKDFALRAAQFMRS